MILTMIILNILSCAYLPFSRILKPWNGLCAQFSAERDSAGRTSPLSSPHTAAPRASGDCWSTFIMSCFLMLKQLGFLFLRGCMLSSKHTLRNSTHKTIVA